MTDAAILVEDLTKVYPTGKKAVDGLTFDVRPGEIFGLLGPNGSGKTTTVRMMVTLLKRTSGVLEVGGFDVEKRPAEVRKIIGYAAQAIGIDDDLTARENLILQGQLHGLSTAEATARTTELLEVMSLTESADLRTMRFSGGMRRRVDLIQALVHRPPVLFLDEPTTGMDPQSRLALWEYLGKLRREGMTILLTTQYLEEADRACDRIAIIDDGKLVRLDTPAALKEELGANRITLELASPVTEDPYDRAAHVLAKVPEVSKIEQVEPLVLAVPDSGTSLPQIVHHIEAEGIQISSIRTTSITLDDVFLRYTGHKIQAEVDKGPTISAAFAAVHGRQGRPT